MWPNTQETPDLVTFTEKIRNGKLHILYSALAFIVLKHLWRKIRKISGAMAYKKKYWQYFHLAIQEHHFWINPKFNFHQINFCLETFGTSYNWSFFPTKKYCNFILWVSLIKSIWREILWILDNKFRNKGDDHSNGTHHSEDGWSRTQNVTKINFLKVSTKELNLFNNVGLYYNP